MTMNNGHVPVEDQADRSAAEAGRLQDTQVSRRQFTKAGLGVSGVILSLASRPVLGNPVCKSPSGFLSGNASTHGPQPVCNGKSPGYWANHLGAWPIPTSTLFSSVFQTSSESPYNDHTFLDLLPGHKEKKDQKDKKDKPFASPKVDKHNLGRHLVAAYLNAVSGFTPFLPVETIRAMFTQWQSKGYFSPTASVQWDAPQIVEYLQATQD